MSKQQVSIFMGGTGANTASDARTNLGVVAVSGDTMTGNLNVAATLITQNVIPNANITYDLGSSEARFKDLWLSNSTIYLGEASISAQGGNVSFGNAEIQLSNVTTKLNVTNDLFVSGNVGIGTTSPTAKLSIDGSVVFNESGADVDFRVEGDTDANLLFVDASADRIGVGTNAPGAKLDIAGVTYVRGDSTDATFTSPGQLAIKRSTNAPFFSFHADNGARIGYIQFDSGAASEINVVANQALLLRTNTVERVRITSTGDVGIGTSSPAAKLHVVGSGTTDQVIIENTDDSGATAPDLVLYRNSSSPAASDNLGYVIFRGKDSAGNLEDYGAIYTTITSATSGSEGGLMVFETNKNGSNGAKMVITSNGDVGIGTSSPSADSRLEVASDASTAQFVDVLKLKTTSTGDFHPGILFENNRNSVANRARIAMDSASSAGTSDLRYSCDNVHRWFIGATERARITAGGYFKASPAGTYVGATDSYHELRGGATNGYTAIVSSDVASPASQYVFDIRFAAATPNNTSALFWHCQDATASRASMRSNGGLANYQSNNVDLSDIRTKKDIAPVASMWNKIGALEIVTYKYNDQTHDDVNVGVIAQQVETVEPVWVDSDGFGETPEGEEPLKTVYTKDITFAAIKALQEAMARIEQLEAKVASLEAK